METKGTLFGLSAGVLWAADGILLGRCTQNAPDMLILTLLTAGVHDTGAALFLLAHNLWRGRFSDYVRTIKSPHFARLFCAALLGGAVGMGANVAAISLAGASYACAITASYPVVGAVIGLVFLHERPRFSAVLGIALVSVGVALLGFSAGERARAGGFSLGIVCAFVAAISWSLEGILATSCMENTHSDVLIGLRELCSSLCYCVILLGAGGFLWLSGSGGSLCLLSGKLPLFLVLASCAGAASFLCWYRSMAQCGAAIGMALNASYALWAAVFDVTVNHTELRLSSVVGMCVMLLGTVATVCAKPSKTYKRRERKR